MCAEYSWLANLMRSIVTLRFAWMHNTQYPLAITQTHGARNSISQWVAKTWIGKSDLHIFDAIQSLRNKQLAVVNASGNGFVRCEIVKVVDWRKFNAQPVVFALRHQPPSRIRAKVFDFNGETLPSHRQAQQPFEQSATPPGCWVFWIQAIWGPPTTSTHIIADLLKRETEANTMTIRANAPGSEIDFDAKFAEFYSRRTA